MIATHEETLMYYDGPVVFTAKGPNGQWFLCEAITPVGEFEYLFVPVTEEALGTYLRGEKDLRGTLIDGSKGGYYLAPLDDSKGDYRLEKQTGQLGATERYLPTPGLFHRFERQ